MKSLSPNSYRRQTQFWFVVGMLIVGALPDTASAQESGRSAHSIQISAGFQSSDWLGTPVELLEDPVGNLTLTDVQNSTNFLRQTRGFMTLGFTDSAHWFRMQVECAVTLSEPLYLELDYGFLDYVDFYILEGDTLLSSLRTGDRFPFDQRHLPVRGFVTPFDCVSGSTRTLYGRVQSTESIMLPLRIWSASAFHKKSYNEQVVYGLILGVIGFIVLFNLLLFIITREQDFGLYSFYLFLHGAFQLSYSGFGFEYFWPNAVEWHNSSVAVLGGLALASGLLFIARFIRLRECAPALVPIFHGTGVCSLVVGCLIPPFVGVQPALIAFSLIAIFGSVIIFLGCVASGRKGIQWGYLTLFAFLPMVLALMLSGLAAVGVLSFDSYILHSPQVAFAVEGMIFAVGVILKMKLLEQRRILAEAHAREVELQAEAKERRLNQELAVAQSLVLGRQMNPHFLSNQLNDATYLIEDNPERAIDQLEELSEFYRVLMGYCTKPIVSVEEEHEVLKQYLAINSEEYERYGITLAFELEGEAEVPSMMIQPLIENSIKHGMELRRDGCKIEARVEKVGDEIMIQVKDNGAGMQGAEPDSFFTPGHALDNVRERLALLYGIMGKLELRENSGGGLCVQLSFPPQTILRDAS